MIMRHSTGKPPDGLYGRLRAKFGIDWDDPKVAIFITYGDTVYSKYPLTPDLEIHEGTHIKQQEAIGKERWWDLYIENKKFRLSQEVEAYRNQIKFMKENYDRKKRKEVEKWIYYEMVFLYGDMCASEDEAKKLLNG